MSAKRKVKEAPSFAELLDAAVAKRWPDVKCETSFSIFSMSYVSNWTDLNGKNLKLALARQVKAFVEGYSAGAVDYQPLTRPGRGGAER